MTLNMRREPRSTSNRTYSVSWQNEDGLTQSGPVQGINASVSGIAVCCPFEIRKGTTVYIQADEGYPSGYTVVRHATRKGTSYIIGLELDEATKKVRPTLEAHQPSDPYEFLQISPKAHHETIQRVYRFLAARYHPDNPETGDQEKFLLLNRAYDILSDPERRARYDEKLKSGAAQPSALFDSVDFLDGVEGEVNRRLAVLSLLYRKCRANVHSPQISLMDLEIQMGFPREYLDFTIWYLRSKKYIKQEDNAELALTPAGVDFVEENYAKLPLLRKLLGTGAPSASSRRGGDREAEPDHAVALPILGPSEAVRGQSGE